MRRSREHRVFEILDGALERWGEDREHFIEVRCEGDETLEGEVLALLEAAVRSEHFLEVGRNRTSVSTPPHRPAPEGVRPAPDPQSDPKSSFQSQAFADRQSRTTVRLETARARAASSKLKPPK